MGKKMAPSAVERARGAWAEMARAARFDLRSIGVVGDLPTLDLMACGVRGAAAPRGLARVAIEMRDHGLSEEAATSRLANVAQRIAALVFHDPAA